MLTRASSRQKLTSIMEVFGNNDQLDQTLSYEQFNDKMDTLEKKASIYPLLLSSDESTHVVLLPRRLINHLLTIQVYSWGNQGI